MGNEVNFLLVDKDVFYKMIVSPWVWVARHAQRTENNQFPVSLQYLKENTKDKVDFLPADKCQRFLQSYFIFLCVWPSIPKLPKITSLLFLCNMLRKKRVMLLIFYMQISMKACYILILRFFDEDNQAFPTSRNSKFAMSLQYPKKEVEVDFLDADKNQNFL